MKAILIAAGLFAVVTASAAPQTTQGNNGSVEGQVTLRGSSEGIGGVQITIEEWSPNVGGRYTPNPALTPAMREDIDALIASYRIGISLEQILNNVARREAQLLGLPAPPPSTAPRTNTIPPQRNSESDSSGHFSFGNLAPGRYRIRAMRDGYFGPAIPGSAGDTLPADSTTTVTVTAGQPAIHLAIALIRGATISGVTRGPGRQAVAGLNIRAYRVTYDNSSVLLQGVSRPQQSNDRGEYRIFNLPPGEYYVAVVAGTVIGQARPQDAYATTFYPGTADTRKARRIVVTGGEEMTTVDIDVQPKPSTTISGRVNNLPATGTNGQPLTATTFFLLPADSSALMDNPVTLLSTATNRSGGQFEIRGILPGNYELMSCVNDQTGHVFEGRARIDVHTEDLKDVAINLEPAVELRIHLTVNGAAPSFTMAPPPPANVDDIGNRGARPVTPPALVPQPRIGLSLRSMEPYAGILPRGLPLECITGGGSRRGTETSFDPSGLYTFQNVTAERYAIQTTGLAANEYVADIRMGSDAAFDSGFTTGNAPSQLEMTVNSNGLTIDGVVRDAAQKPFASARVALVPQEKRRKNTLLYKSALTDAAGHFTISGVAPGEYTLFAWEAVPNNAWMNAEFLARYEDRGQRISVKAGSSPKVELQMIPVN